MKPALDYPLMDSLLRAGKRTSEICDIMGCVHSSVSHRRKKLGLGVPPQTQIGTIDHAPFIPPARRLELALQKKAIALGVPYEWAREVWLRGAAGRQFRADGAYQ